MDTGRTDARVPEAATGDALDELSRLFNVMLSRITALIQAMRDSLDNVAHDLRTPIARWRAVAERAPESGDPELQRNALADCLEESDRIVATLDTLMDISEAETGTMRLEKQDVSVRKLVSEVRELFDDAAEEKGVAIRADDVGDVRVFADPVRLRRVIANLLDNAIKYTPRGGEIRISARASGNETELIVRDTGVGIAPEDLPRIWDRLYRGNRSRTERGLGLGLSLVKAFVAAHGGRIRVESELNRGSTFTVVLPAR